MKRAAIPISLIALVLFGGGCSHVQPGSRINAPAASIQVERPENNGSVNILPCLITFSGGQTVKLSGGEAASISVSAGHMWVEAFSADPYRPESSNLRAWRSHRLHLHLRPGDVIRLSVEPKFRGSTYIGGWVVEPAANKGGPADVGLRLSVFLAKWPFAVELFR